MTEVLAAIAAVVRDRMTVHDETGIWTIRCWKPELIECTRGAH